MGKTLIMLQNLWYALENDQQQFQVEDLYGLFCFAEEQQQPYTLRDGVNVGVRKMKACAAVSL